MPNTDTYNRPKLAGVNATAMVKSMKVSEGPNAVAALDPDTGTDGIFTSDHQADLTEGGTATEDVQTIMRSTQEMIIDVVGNVSLQVKVFSVTGAGVATQVGATANYPHPQNMDTIQADGGRARQT